MRFKIFENHKVVQELRWGLPSKCIMDNPSVIVVKHPSSGMYIVLKSRICNKDLLKLKYTDFELYDTPYCENSWLEDYKHLNGKYIIIDEAVLNKRGREALHKLCV